MATVTFVICTNVAKELTDGNNNYQQESAVADKPRATHCSTANVLQTSKMNA